MLLEITPLPKFKRNILRLGQITLVKELPLLQWQSKRDSDYKRTNVLTLQELRMHLLCFCRKRALQP